MKGTTGFLVLVGGLLAIIGVTIVLFVTGHTKAAGVVSAFGTPLWLLLILVFVVVFDSRSRWPGVSVFRRLVNVLTFTG